MLEEQLGRRGDAVAPLRPVLLRTLADVQQRLTFRVQAFIKARGPTEKGLACLRAGPLSHEASALACDRSRSWGGCALHRACAGALHRA